MKDVVSHFGVVMFQLRLMAETVAKIFIGKH